MAKVDLWKIYKSICARVLRAQSEQTRHKAQVMADAAKELLSDPTLQQVRRLEEAESDWIQSRDVTSSAQRLAPRFHTAIASGNFVINRPHIKTRSLGQNDEKGIVYCASTKSKKGQIKIGVTGAMSLEERLRKLENKYGYSKVKALYWVRVTCPYEVEDEAQKLLRDKRVSGRTAGDSTEWYAVDEEAAIRAIGTAIENLGVDVLERMTEPNVIGARLAVTVSAPSTADKVSQSAAASNVAGKYSGETRDGKYHGYGTYSWPDGGQYSGEWKDGLKHGQGTMVWAEGDRYVGEWSEGQMHGQGAYIELNGEKYVGNWIEGSQTGFGMQSFVDGRVYCGELVEFSFHGFGTMTWLDGRKYVGEWANGKRCGFGIFTSANGAEYAGKWSDDFSASLLEKCIRSLLKDVFREQKKLLQFKERWLAEDGEWEAACLKYKREDSRLIAALEKRRKLVQRLDLLLANFDSVFDFAPSFEDGSCGCFCCEEEGFEDLARDKWDETLALLQEERQFLYSEYLRANH